MQISKEQYSEWRQSDVTKEWFELFRYRQQRYEELIPALIATGTDEAISQARVASGRHQELDDLLKTEYEDMT